MRKKLVALALVVAMLSICIIGGTLAYFSDTDEETNTFTMGNVDIELVEQQRVAGDTSGALEDFENNKTLLPGEKNDVDKIVSVENVGSSEAYCWIEVWVPKELDGNGLVLTYNTTATKYKALGAKEVDGQTCNGYVYYNKSTALAAKTETVGEDGAETEVIDTTGTILEAVGLSEEVTQGTTGLKLTNGNEYKGKYEVTVVGVGIQAEGFETISDAIDAYYTENPVTSTEATDTPDTPETPEISSEPTEE